MKQKGFTLIELLAVIVILAIIALIAIPTDGNPNKPNAEKSSGNPAPTVKTYTVGEAVNYDPETNQKCETPTSTTGTKTGCMKWYVIKDNGNSVDVILDHNTTAKVAYETSGTYKEYAQASIKTQVDTDTASWTQGLNPRLITANEIASITGNIGWDSATATYAQFFYFGSNKATDYSSQTEEQKAKQQSLHWLFDYTNNCTKYGCTTANSSTYGYWSSSPVADSSCNAWCVYSHGDLVSNRVGLGGDFGVRPVITINKSVLN